MLPATRRNEKKIFELLLAGKCTKEIAEVSGLTWRAVKWYMGNIYKKHGVQDRLQLMAKFIRRK